MAAAERASRVDSAMDDEEGQRRILVECATLLMKGKDASEEFRVRTSALRKTAADTRVAIREALGDCTCAALNGASLPKYIRVVESSSVGAINPETVAIALADLTMSDFEDGMRRLVEKERRKRVADRRQLTLVDGLVFTLYEKIRNSKKSGKTNVKMTDTLPKGVRAESVSPASADVLRLCNSLFQVLGDLKQIADEKKRKEEEHKARLEALEEEAQSILLDRRKPEEDVETTTRGNFKLRCKRQERFPPVKLTQLRDEVLPSAFEQIREAITTPEDVGAFLQDRQRIAMVVERVKRAFEDREPIVSTKLSLDKVGSRFVGMADAEDA